MGRIHANTGFPLTLTTSTSLHRLHTSVRQETRLIPRKPPVERADPMVHMLQLPQEIIDSVIGELADDRASLKRCSIVSSSFCGTAQKFIFRQLTISLSTKAEFYHDRLQHFLLSNPHLALHVECLLLKVNSNRRDEKIPWLPSVIRQIPHLRRVNMVLGSPALVEVNHRQWEWRLLPETLRNGILQLLQLPTIHDLSIHYIRGFPINALRYCPQLKTLDLQALTESDFEWNAFQISPPSQPPLLRHGFLYSLNVGDPNTCRQLQHALSDPSSLLSLSRLAYYKQSNVRDNADLGSCQVVLKTCAPTLKGLRLDVHPSSFQVLDLCDLHSLQNIFFSLRCSSLRNILSVLYSVPVVNSLQEVGLRISQTMMRPDAKDTWRCIDDLLTTERYRIHLRRVVLHVLANFDLDRASFFREVMPKLHSRRYLFVCFAFERTVSLPPI
ncbi:hypothetical protein FPV67DRAFT_164405 [Lyophyllum atratum]|nr:hypothetical protein FPV67DRAFT_164405 [Lyophyllum atratum]